MSIDMGTGKSKLLLSWRLRLRIFWLNGVRVRKLSLAHQSVEDLKGYPSYKHTDKL